MRPQASRCASGRDDKRRRNSGTEDIVLSPSATVYGIPKYLPLDEKHPLCPTNPYGRTKLVIEEMLKDLCRSDDDWRVR